MTRPRVVLPNSRIGDWYGRKDLIPVCHEPSYQCPNCFERMHLFCCSQIPAPKHFERLSTPFRRYARHVVIHDVRMHDPSTKNSQLLVVRSQFKSRTLMSFPMSKEPITLQENGNARVTLKNSYSGEGPESVAYTGTEDFFFDVFGRDAYVCQSVDCS